MDTNPKIDVVIPVYRPGKEFHKLCWIFWTGRRFPSGQYGSCIPRMEENCLPENRMVFG